jgi:hypothetical protein
VPTPPPPTQQQADEAQQARYAAEVAVLALFLGARQSGSEESSETSSLHSVRMATIIAILSAAIVVASFRDPRDRDRKLLEAGPDNDAITEEVLPEAEQVFRNLLSSELDDEQRAIIWATWVYSQTADAIAEAVAGSSEGEFAGKKLKKVWISRSDGRVRELHRKLHGKTVSSSGDFWRWPATGQRLRWPGDPQAPLDATIGCRCVCLLTWASQDDVSSTIRKIIIETDPN